MGKTEKIPGPEKRKGKRKKKKTKKNRRKKNEIGRKG